MAKWYLSETGKLRRHHDNVEEVMKELQEVANALGLPIEDNRVAYEWCERGNTYDEKVSDALTIFYHMIPIDEWQAHSNSR